MAHPPAPDGKINSWQIKRLRLLLKPKCRRTLAIRRRRFCSMPEQIPPLRFGSASAARCSKRLHLKTSPLCLFKAQISKAPVVPLSTTGTGYFFRPQIQCVPTGYPTRGRAQAELGRGTHGSYGIYVFPQPGRSLPAVSSIAMPVSHPFQTHAFQTDDPRLLPIKDKIEYHGTRCKVSRFCYKISG